MNKKIEDPIEGVTQVRALIDASGNDIEGTVAGAKWSADAPGSHRLSVMTLVSAEVNKPIPPRIFKLSTWDPKKKPKSGT